MIEDLKKVRDALEALLNYQQADIDGVMVLTSRQAIHEVSDYVRATIDRIIAEATPSTDALKILRHVNNWSEIETAPKDGTEILLGRVEDGVIEDIIKDYWYEDRVMAAWAEYPAVFDNSPTHWARLPLLLGCSAPNAQPEKLDVDALKREVCEKYACDIEVETAEVRGIIRMLIDHLASAGYLRARLPKIDGLEEAIEWEEKFLPARRDALMKAGRAYLKASGV